MAVYHGPAASHLTLYIEPQNGKLRLAAQDIQNKSAPHGLTQGPLRGGYNGKFYDSQEPLFTDDKWHLVEALFKLNSLDRAHDKPYADGIVHGWFDGKPVVDRRDVVLRSTISQRWNSTSSSSRHTSVLVCCPKNRRCGSTN